MSSEEIGRAVRLALAEDLGNGDVTSLATVPEEAGGRAGMRAREPLGVAGLALADAAFSWSNISVCGTVALIAFLIRTIGKSATPGARPPQLAARLAAVAALGLENLWLR